MTDVGGCFLDEDGEESIHGFLYVDLLTGIKQLLNELEDVLDEEGFTSAEKVQDGNTVLIDDVGDVLGMIFVDFSEFCDAVVAKAPAVSLDVGFDEIAGIVKILDGLKVLEGDFLDRFDWGLFVVAHEI